MNTPTPKKLKPAKRYTRPGEGKSNAQDCRGHERDIVHYVDDSEVDDDPELSDDYETHDLPVAELAPSQQDKRIADTPTSESSQSECDTIQLPEFLRDDKLFYAHMESVINSVLTNRANARIERCAEEARQRKARGIKDMTVNDYLDKIIENYNKIADSYNAFKEGKGLVAQNVAATNKFCEDFNAKLGRLEVLVKSVERVMGVKAPIRPPFPSWACLAYLFWHWPVYAFARAWCSKFFRRFCYICTLLVVLIQTGFILFLAADNRVNRYAQAKYVAARNWAYVEHDSTSMHRFDYLDLLYAHPDWNKQDIENLNNSISKKHEENLRIEAEKRKRKK